MGGVPEAGFVVTLALALRVGELIDEEEVVAENGAGHVQSFFFFCILLQIF